MIQLVNSFGTKILFFHWKMCIFDIQTIEILIVHWFCVYFVHWKMCIFGIQTIEILIFHWFCVYFVDLDRPCGVYFVDADRPSGPAGAGSGWMPKIAIFPGK